MYFLLCLCFRCIILFLRHSYHELFPLYNKIAQRAIKSIGGSVLPDIWSHALPLWRDHTRGPKQDTLHWCFLRPNSVISFWNERLMDFVYNQIEETESRAGLL